jgi:prepilin-type N-terminal cleavage/methylation domain-containing protein
MPRKKLIPYHQQKAFSLVELLISMAMISVVILLLMSFQTQIFSLEKSVNSSIEKNYSSLLSDSALKNKKNLTTLYLKYKEIMSTQAMFVSCLRGTGTNCKNLFSDTATIIPVSNDTSINDPIRSFFGNTEIKTINSGETITRKISANLGCNQTNPSDPTTSKLCSEFKVQIIIETKDSAGNIKHASKSSTSIIPISVVATNNLNSDRGECEVTSGAVSAVVQSDGSIICAETAPVVADCDSLARNTDVPLRSISSLDSTACVRTVRADCTSSASRGISNVSFGAGAGCSYVTLPSSTTTSTISP